MSKSKTPQLYSTKKTIKPLESLSDALGRELKTKDFVTAVFSDGELTLFQVERFERHKADYFMDYSLLEDKPAKVRAQGITLMRSETYDYLVLNRVQGTIAYVDGDKKFNSKPVLKTSKQVAYADPSFVMLHYFAN
jgi:hypothetical protein